MSPVTSRALRRLAIAVLLIAAAAWLVVSTVAMNRRRVQRAIWYSTFVGVGQTVAGQIRSYRDYTKDTGGYQICWLAVRFSMGFLQEQRSRLHSATGRLIE